MRYIYIKVASCGSCPYYSHHYCSRTGSTIESDDGVNIDCPLPILEEEFEVEE